MGRGGGRAGGSSGRAGGFSSGGGRGFSGRRSSGLGGRGGFGSSGRGPGAGGFGSPPPRRGAGSGGFGSPPRAPRPPRPPFSPPPRRPLGIPYPRPVFIPVGTARPNSKRASSSESPGGSFSGPPPSSQSGAPSNKPGKRGIPSWYKWLSVLMLILAVFLLVQSSKAMSAAGNEPAREKLPASACVSTDQWIDDRLNWLSDTGTVVKAMKHFYSKTGVQPYLLICDNMDGDGASLTHSQAEAYLGSLYDSLYQDEGHLIFAFMEYAPSQYATYVYTGVAADSVIDQTAREILLNDADRYYTDTSLSDDQFFAKIFTEAADSIMADPAGRAKTAAAFALAAVVILVVMAGGLIAFKIQEKKAEEARELRQILDTPLPKASEEVRLEQTYGSRDHPSDESKPIN